MSYAEGFEDAIELCLNEIDNAKSLDILRAKIQEFVDLVKERKFDRIKILLSSR